MIQKIRNTILTISMLLMASVAPGLAISGVAAAQTATGACASGNNVDYLNQGANIATGSGATCAPPTSGKTGLADIAKTVINILSLIVGIVAVIMIVYGGLRYVTSGGSSEGVGSAKNTIIYAIVGLIIVALAQLIVHFILSNVGSSGGNVTS